MKYSIIGISLILLTLLTLYCMNFYDDLKKIYMAVGLFKNECSHEINNKILLEKCYLKLHFMTVPMRTLYILHIFP